MLDVFIVSLCVFIQLWRFVLQPEEGTPAALRGSDRSRLPAIVASLNQSGTEFSHPTNRAPFDPLKHQGQIPFRRHANYVPARSWSHPIIFPRRWFLHRQISSADIYSVSGDANDFTYLLPVCVYECVSVCVCGREADGSTVWCLEGCMEMLAESCWSPACIHHSTSLHFAFSSLRLICLLELLSALKNSPYFTSLSPSTLSSFVSLLITLSSSYFSLL